MQYFPMNSIAIALHTASMRVATLAALLIFLIGATAIGIEPCAAESTTGAVPSAIENTTQKLAPFSTIRIEDQYLKRDITGGSNGPVLTLIGAVDVAIAHNRDLEQARLECSRFKWDRLAVESTRLPGIKVLSYLSDQVSNSQLIPRGLDAFVFATALVPITQQYRIGLTAHVAQLATEIAYQKLRREMDDMRFKVKSAYYKLALDRSLLSELEDSISYLQQLQATVDNEVATGKSLKVDAMQVRARLSKMRLEETKAKNALNIDQEKLNHLLGRELDTGIRLETIPPPSAFELDVHKAEEAALASRPELREVNARIKQVSLEKKVLFSHYIPNVSVGAVYVALPGFNNQVVARNALAPGFFVSYDGFDWGRHYIAAKARGTVQKAAALSAENVRDDILIDVHSQINKVTESRQQIESAELTRTAAKEEMRVAVNRYKFTAAKLSDVLQAQSALAEATKSYEQALLALYEAEADFERAMGN